MSVELAARFLGDMAAGLEFGLAVARRGADKISERFPSPVSFRVGHGIGISGYWARLRRGHVSQKPGL